MYDGSNLESVLLPYLGQGFGYSGGTSSQIYTEYIYVPAYSVDAYFPAYPLNTFLAGCGGGSSYLNPTYVSDDDIEEMGLSDNTSHKPYIKIWELE